MFTYTIFWSQKQTMYRSKDSTIQILLEFMAKTENHRHKKTYVNIKQ